MKIKKRGNWKEWKLRGTEIGMYTFDLFLLIFCTYAFAATAITLRRFAKRRNKWFAAKTQGTASSPCVRSFLVGIP